MCQVALAGDAFSSGFLLWAWQDVRSARGNDLQTALGKTFCLQSNSQHLPISCTATGGECKALLPAPPTPSIVMSVVVNA